MFTSKFLKIKQVFLRFSKIFHRNLQHKKLVNISLPSHRYRPSSNFGNFWVRSTTSPNSKFLRFKGSSLEGTVGHHRSIVRPSAIRRPSSNTLGQNNFEIFYVVWQAAILLVRSRKTLLLKTNKKIGSSRT